VHPLPAEADTTIGTAALALRGDRIDERSQAQVEAQREWRSPRFRGASA
jgi:adenosylhomocysteinase